MNIKTPFVPHSGSLNILLTGGRAPATLALARLFYQAGHRVVVADSLPQQLCTWSRVVAKNSQVPAPRADLKGYLAALIAIIQTEQIDWLIPTCEEIFYIAWGLPQLTQYCQVLAEPLDRLEPLHNKWAFIQFIQSLGLPAPKTVRVTSRSELSKSLTQFRDAQVILKPVYSRFASRVKWVSLPVVCLPAIDVRADYPWVIQSFVDGQQYCLYGVAHQGVLNAYAAYPVSFTADAGSCIYFEAIDQLSLQHWMQTVVKALGFTGQIAFDVIVTQAGVIYPLECNPRAISAIHLFRPGDGLVQACLNQATRLAQPATGYRCMLGLAMVLYGLPMALNTGQLRDWWQHFWGTSDVLLHGSDPAPFFGVGPLLWQFWQISRQTGQSLQQAATQDIEWDGEPLA